MLTWLIGILVTLTIPTLFTLLIASYQGQIRDLKDQVNTLLPEVRNLGTAIRDMTATQRAREGR